MSKPEEKAIHLDLASKAGGISVRAGSILSVKRCGDDVAVTIDGPSTFYCVDRPGLMAELLQAWIACELAADERAERVVEAIR